MNGDHITKAEQKQIRKQERQEWEEKIQKEQQTKNIKKIAYWAGLAVILVLSVWGLIALVNAPTTSTTTLTAPAVTTADITTGPKTAKVTLVEYADFQCPACGAYHPLTKQILKDFNGKIYFVYRFFPLETLHQNALASAHAAYAAYLQGKFWQMHDMLFETQKDWATVTDPTSIFNGYAGKLGLDMTKFQQDSNAATTQKFISDEEDAGVKAGVNSTPTFFLNSKQIQNPQSYNEFKQLIQDELNKK